LSDEQVYRLLEREDLLRPEKQRSGLTCLGETSKELARRTAAEMLAEARQHPGKNMLEALGESIHEGSSGKKSEPKK
ncbi:unnamed protein product, partial [marine sediment metagenome]